MCFARILLSPAQHWIIGRIVCWVIFSFCEVWWVFTSESISSKLFKVFRCLLSNIFFRSVIHSEEEGFLSKTLPCKTYKFINVILSVNVVNFAKGCVCKFFLETAFSPAFLLSQPSKTKKYDLFCRFQLILRSKLISDNK